MNIVTDVSLMRELDGMVDNSRRDMPPGDLVKMQSEISAVKYTLSTYMTMADAKQMKAEDTYDTFITKKSLSLQAVDKKSAARAKVEAEADGQAEIYRLAYIDARIEYMAIKNRVDNAKDVLVSLSMRIKNAEQEAIESRMQQHHA